MLSEPVSVVKPAVALALAAVLTGCHGNLYDPQMAARPYPRDLHTTNVADIHVFRDGTTLEIVNSTPHSYQNFDLWVNQRYVAHVDQMAAGQTIRLSLWDFRDEFGDGFNAGGFFRTRPATPVRMVEIQAGPQQPMIGLVAIRAEEIVPRPQRGRLR